MSSFSASIVHELPPDQVELIRSFLRNYNHQANPVWWERMEDPENDWKPLQVVIHGGEHEVVGGLLATTSMSWLRIQIMAVREGHRRRGFGSLMLDKAEEEARRRGCKYAFLDTMEYQAPEFYRRKGYVEVGSIPDWDSHYHTKFYFTKQL